MQFVLPRQSTQRHTAVGPAEYFTYQLHKQFRPVRSGSQAIPPVFVKANLPTQVDARGRATRTEKIVASSAPLTVEVRPVPSAGQPASFSGAVGRFSLKVEAQPKVLKVGDPLTVTVTLRGEGLLETVLPPALHNQTALTQAFKLHDDPAVVKDRRAGENVHVYAASTAGELAGLYHPLRWPILTRMSNATMYSAAIRCRCALMPQPH